MQSDNKSPAWRAAMNALARMQPAATDMVQYVSRGRALALTPPPPFPAPAADALAPLTLTAAPVAEPDSLQVEGYLGAFKVQYAGKELPPADIILDYHSPPLITRRRPRLHALPLGYFAAAENEQETLAAAREMIGTFTKPRYFSYQPEICMHSASAVSGCSRCLDACAAQAIASAGDKISVNPYLCQGCGGCVMTCPSGALRYAYPPAADMLETLRAAVSAYCRESADAPAVLFYAADRAAAVRSAQLPPHVLPVAIEEAGAAGLELWFAVLAFGAAHVAVYADSPALGELAGEQLGIARAVLDALGLPPAISVITDMTKHGLPPPAASLAPPAQFAGGNDKRQMFFMALNHFVDHAAASAAEAELIPLPPGAPFGEIIVDSERCTLCMACAGACSVSAVRAGGSAPRLTFIEENCVQCGLCAATCPEDAIRLQPRLHTDKNARRQPRLLHEDQPLRCLRCQKPFASARIVSRIEEKLKAHWMFQQPQELRRLRLCEECRVLDMFDGERQ